ncbi:helix-turn-helix domain-containing protein [Streptomyces jumonjinensis]|uniref:Helix-turn-helix domain-containing protein n=1 Tax=Streptomyces jumonjinensis TaxID=1945 RepID=A0A646KEX1_STRJU|nr:helix-turn-helix transcriptional regulator [Streptomyces jumonjinensis]MQT00621.1 helix-turn-helix domain-containing protein [Streptomyces jumonjinensis]
MAESPSSAVREARRTLGNRLREMRKGAGFTTARAFAARAGWSESKASRMENGVTSPSREDLRQYAELCGAPDTYADLVAALHNIDELYVEWWRVEGRGLEPVQRARVPLYQRTRRFRVYEPSVIPGLVQTPDYARVIMSRIIAFSGIPDDTEKAVEARIHRQSVLYDASRRFALLVEEAALRARFGDAGIMAAQLGHLLKAAALPQVSFGIIPMSADRVMWPVEGFWIFDDRQVLIELVTAEVTVKQPSEIAFYTRTFAELAAMACYGPQARALIADAISALG